jgi:DNA-binding transcriptional ArsR family regulator
LKDQAVSIDEVNPYAEMFSAIGTGPRLRIMRALLSAHPDGMIVDDIHVETGVAGSTLSHHLEKLRHQNLIGVRREGTFLWYSVRIESLQQLLRFLYAECCTRNRLIEPGTLTGAEKEQRTGKLYGIQPH